MGAFILRRLLQAGIVMVSVAFIAFLLFQYVGDPVVFLLGQDATPEQVAARIRAGLAVLPAERLVPAPDCGMKYQPRERAFGKLQALALGAAIVRRELGA